MELIRLLKYWPMRPCVRAWVALLLGVSTVLSLVTVSQHELIRCTVQEDCPTGGFCFKDECARCLCPEDYQVITMYHEGELSQTCQLKEDRPLRVGDPCDPDKGLRCPVGSHCDHDTGVCVCNPSLRAHQDFSHCRRGVLTEFCDKQMKCEKDLGLQCKKAKKECICRPSYHPPTNWTQYVLNRWDYSTVEGEPQQCVARAVGEPCDGDEQCGAVEGSGAHCGACGFCECSTPDHVPDVLGTKCGPALGPGQSCTLNSVFVCDGRRGLQCGDVCDLYSYDFRRKICRCSQMHDRTGLVCVPKQVGSPCFTDLDCYPIREGYGYCERGRCAADIPASGPTYKPYLSERACKHKKLPVPSGGNKPHKADGSAHAHKHKDPAGKYPHDDKELKVTFDNLTAIFDIEPTTQITLTTKMTTVRVQQRAVTSGGPVAPPWDRLCALSALWCVFQAVVR